MRLPPGASMPQEPSWPLTLRAGGLVLRPLRRSDAEQWARVRGCNAAWLRPWDATNPPGSPRLASFAEMVHLHARQGREGTGLPLAICWDAGWPERPDRRPPLIGYVSVSGIVWGAAQMGHIGYWIDRDYAGRGLMPAAVALVSDYCLQVLGLHRLEVNIRPENEASLRVVEKLGFRDEGLRLRFLHIDGGWRDHRSFALTADEATAGVLARYVGVTGVPRQP